MLKNAWNCYFLIVSFKVIVSNLTDWANKKLEPVKVL